LLELDEVKLSNQVAISNVFSNFFHEPMGMTTLDIGVIWKQYYPTESQPPLLSLEEPFNEEEI